jgi:hypothetical protein
VSLQFLGKVDIVNKHLHRENGLIDRFFMRETGNVRPKPASTDFHPSGSRMDVILVLIPGKGPGSRTTCPPNSFATSAVL